MMLALVGIPLGTSSKRGGRSSGYVWAIFLCFCCYYMGFIGLTNMARSHTLSPIVASWLPNVVFGIAGVIMIARMEMPGDRDILGRLTITFARWWASISGKLLLTRSHHVRLGPHSPMLTYPKPAPRGRAATRR